MKNNMPDWIKEFPGDITLCNSVGEIIYMNESSVESFHNYGGAELVGTNLLDCHPEPSKTQLREMLERGERNIYITEKDGAKKLIYQSPWFSEGKYAGFVEISLPLPENIPLKSRD